MAQLAEKHSVETDFLLGFMLFIVFCSLLLFHVIYLFLCSLLAFTILPFVESSKGTVSFWCNFKCFDVHDLPDGLLF